MINSSISDLSRTLTITSLSYSFLDSSFIGYLCSFLSLSNSVSRLLVEAPPSLLIPRLHLSFQRHLWNYPTCPFQPQLIFFFSWSTWKFICFLSSVPDSAKNPSYQVLLQDQSLLHHYLDIYRHLRYLTFFVSVSGYSSGFWTAALLVSSLSGRQVDKSSLA